MWLREVISRNCKRKGVSSSRILWVERRGEDEAVKVGLARLLMDLYLKGVKDDR